MEDLDRLLSRVDVPMLAKVIHKTAVPLATAALSGFALTGINKLFGKGIKLP